MYANRNANGMLKDYTENILSSNVPTNNETLVHSSIMFQKNQILMPEWYERLLTTWCQIDQIAPVISVPQVYQRLLAVAACQIPG